MYLPGRWIRQCEGRVSTLEENQTIVFQQQPLLFEQQVNRKIELVHMIQDNKVVDNSTNDIATMIASCKPAQFQGKESLRFEEGSSGEVEGDDDHTKGKINDGKSSFAMQLKKTKTQAATLEIWSLEEEYHCKHKEGGADVDGSKSVKLRYSRVE
eukprot:Gb_18635 [translate_table: standard]